MGHFHNLLCEEMSEGENDLFPEGFAVNSGKYLHFICFVEWGIFTSFCGKKLYFHCPREIIIDLRYKVIIFSRGSWNDIPVRNEGISTFNFLINQLKKSLNIKKINKNPAKINAHFTKWKISDYNENEYLSMLSIRAIPLLFCGVGGNLKINTKYDLEFFHIWLKIFH